MGKFHYRAKKISFENGIGAHDENGIGAHDTVEIASYFLSNFVNENSIVEQNAVRAGRAKSELNRS